MARLVAHCKDYMLQADERGANNKMIPDERNVRAQENSKLSE